MFARISKQADRAFSSVNLQGLSVPAKVGSAIVVATGVGLTTVVLVQAFVGEEPASTVGLVIPFMALYVSMTVALIALLDWGVRRILGKASGDNANPS